MAMAAQDAALFARNSTIDLVAVHCRRNERVRVSAVPVRLMRIRAHRQAGYHTVGNYVTRRGKRVLRTERVPLYHHYQFVGQVGDETICRRLSQPGWEIEDAQAIETFPGYLAVVHDGHTHTCASLNLGNMSEVGDGLEHEDIPGLNPMPFSADLRQFLLFGLRGDFAVRHVRGRDDNGVAIQRNVRAHCGSRGTNDAGVSPARNMLYQHCTRSVGARSFALNWEQVLAISHARFGAF